MKQPTPREQLIEKITQLSDEEVLKTLDYLTVISPPASSYDSERDPFVHGLFDGSIDLAERTDAILEAGFGREDDDDAV